MKFNKCDLTDEQLNEVQGNLIWKNLQEKLKKNLWKVLNHCDLDWYVDGEVVCPIISWPSSLRLIFEKHRFELEALLKLVWFHTNELNSENYLVYGQVEREVLTESQLIGYQKTIIRISKNQKSAKLPRIKLPLVKKWIKKMLQSDPNARGESLWEKLPTSDEFSEFYLDGDRLWSTENLNKSLSKRAFCEWVERIKNG
ncbi:unknown protein [Waddlia chondrophila 2032/99]|uniref:Uncharacterized protein n=1 Tax=Waddlia chondrophila 2032/99 TaxID=765953 RepID=F8LCB6_9BACT|nr:unknown protein [Waddlia chondrophila 2032/99]